MANQYKNKVVYNGNTLIDLTGVTVTPSVLAQGYTALDASGAPITGTMSGGGVDGDNLAYGNYVPAIIGQAIVGFSLVGEQTQPIVGTALTGLTVIGG